MSKRAKRGFAAVWKQRSGRYAVRYTLPDGRRVSAGRTFEDKKAAESWAVDKRRELERRLDGEREQISFRDYSTTWLKNRCVKGRPIKQRTRAHYDSILKDHVLPTFGHRMLDKITVKDVRDWHAATLVDKPTLRAHAYSLLRTIMQSAVNDDLIDANPCRIVGAGRSNRVIKIRPATVEELTIITDTMPQKLRLMVLLASWTALRFGETIELRRKDVDLHGEVIRIRRAAVRIPGTKSAFEVTTPKSDAGVRDVSIPPHLIPIIEDHLSKHVGKFPDSLLFANTSGEHLQPSTVARHWYKARAKADRSDLRWHDLRHTAATMTASCGASIAELMARLGHSSPQAAMRYQHAAQSRDKELAALLSKLAAV